MNWLQLRFPWLWRHIVIVVLTNRYPIQKAILVFFYKIWKQKSKWEW